MAQPAKSLASPAGNVYIEPGPNRPLKKSHNTIAMKRFCWFRLLGLVVCLLGAETSRVQFSPPSIFSRLGNLAELAEPFFRSTVSDL